MTIRPEGDALRFSVADWDFNCVWVCGVTRMSTLLFLLQISYEPIIAVVTNSLSVIWAVNGVESARVPKVASSYKQG